MARKNRDLSNVFDSLQSKESKKVVNGNDSDDNVSLMETEDIQEESDSKQVINVYDDSVSEESTPLSDVPYDPSYNEDTEKDSNDFSEFKKDILSKYDEKRKKKTMEETHIRTTFLLERSLSKRLDKLTKNKRGLKTLVLNDAVEAIVKAMEDDS